MHISYTYVHGTSGAAKRSVYCIVYSYRVLVGTEVFGSIGGVAEALVTAMVCATVRSFTGV